MKINEILLNNYIQLNEFEIVENYLKDELAKSNYSNKDIAEKLILLLVNSRLNDSVLAYKIATKYCQIHQPIDEVFLLKCYLEMRYMGSLTDESLNTIENNKIDTHPACFKFFIADYYQLKKNPKAGLLFQEISETSPDFLYSHFRLFKYYKSLNSIENKNFYVVKIIKSLYKVYGPNERIEMFDLDSFINENIKGSYLSKVNFESILMEVFDSYKV